MSKHRYGSNILVSGLLVSVSFPRKRVLRDKFFLLVDCSKRTTCLYLIFGDDCIMFDFSFQSLASCSVKCTTQVESLLIVLEGLYYRLTNL